MSSMICREYLDNFLSFFLLSKLFTVSSSLFTTFVNSYLLIINVLHTLSTILNFGANIISLYLFSAKNGGNLLFFVRIKVLIYTYHVP